MKSIPIGIAAEIRSELAKRQMTMKDLARESGLSYDSVRRKVGSESREITISELSSIAAALGTPITEFMRRAEEAASARGHNNPLDGKDVA